MGDRSSLGRGSNDLLDFTKYFSLHGLEGDRGYLTTISPPPYIGTALLVFVGPFERGLAGAASQVGTSSLAGVLVLAETRAT